MGANNNQPKSGRMVALAAVTAAAMTVVTAAAVTAVTAGAETKAAVAAATAVSTAKEAAADVAAMVAETLSWQWPQQLQLWHVGKIWAMSGHIQSPGDRTATLEICVFDLDYPKNRFFS